MVTIFLIKTKANGCHHILKIDPLFCLIETAHKKGQESVSLLLL
jgi:hypothetical protein